MEALNAERNARREAIIRGLVFAPELMRVFQGGARIRDDDSFPGRKYLVAHAARELRNKLFEYVAAFGKQTIARSSKVDRARVLPEIAPRWVADISPELTTFANSNVVAEIATVTVSVHVLQYMDPLMRHEAEVPRKALDRQLLGLRPLEIYVTPEALRNIVNRWLDMPLHKHAHVPSPGETTIEAEALALWDEVENHLFDLVGSAAWAYVTLANEIEEFNSL